MTRRYTGTGRGEHWLPRWYNRLESRVAYHSQFCLPPAILVKGKGVVFENILPNASPHVLSSIWTTATAIAMEYCGAI